MRSSEEYNDMSEKFEKLIHAYAAAAAAQGQTPSIHDIFDI